MALVKQQFVDNTQFSNRTFTSRLTKLPLPALPAALDPEPWSVGVRPKGRASTYVMGREEEKTMFLRYNNAKRMVNVYLKASKRAEAAAFFAQAMHLREYIIRINMPLIYSQVARNLGRLVHLDWNTAVSECQLPLLNACNKFNVDNGTKFSTYACRAILNSLSRSNGVTGKKSARVKSVELPEIHGEILPEQGDPLGEAKESLKDVWDMNRADLSSTEKYTLTRRYGLDGEPTSTLEEVGEVIGVTKERVRQIQNKALAKLRPFIAA